ncbi:MAG: hypothetical protein KDC07_07595 [Chitinophagaceae bacterium]|nr:hypothetical protein [Chitinophagaceae bacterium]MCB9045947.1 hypothetical protein [Chitinophagales bacterium]
MRRLLYILLIACLVSCNRYDARHAWMQAGVSGMTSEKGVVNKDGKPFSGYVYSLFSTGDTEYVRHYDKGRLNGVSRGWYADGQQKFLYTYNNDVYDGSVKEWFPNGKLYRSFNYKNGQESGLQTMYWDSGVLRANYEAKNGRKYGFTGIKNCTSPIGDIPAGGTAAAGVQ